MLYSCLIGCTFYYKNAELLQLDPFLCGSALYARYFALILEDKYTFEAERNHFDLIFLPLFCWWRFLYSGNSVMQLSSIVVYLTLEEVNCQVEKDCKQNGKFFTALLNVPWGKLLWLTLSITAEYIVMLMVLGVTLCLNQCKWIIQYLLKC